MPERIDMLVNDVQNHAKTISEMTLLLADFKRDKAVQEVESRHLDERLERIEHSIAAIYKLGWWILAAFGGTFIATVANFVMRGGFFVP